MKFRRVIIIGLAIRLLIAPFFAHPFDVYVWYVQGQNFVKGIEPVSSFLEPYDYSLFLFVFPATLLFDFLSKFIPTLTLQMSSLNPILNPGSPWNITIVPGLVFDLLVKLALIVSDSIISFTLYRLVLKHFGNERSAIFVSMLWFLNPLTIWISSGWGMFDTLPTLFTVLALYLILENRFELAGVSITLAVAMKYYAVVLIVPLLILSFNHGGRPKMTKTILYTTASGLILFLPYLNAMVSGFTRTITSESSVQLHYSGLSFWSALTLYYSNIDQTTISLLLVFFAILLCYTWTWKNRRVLDLPTLTTISFYLPIACFLMFYEFIGENFFVWMLPFMAITSLKDKWSTRTYWILSVIVLISSLADSLLVYYLLPLSPWIGSYLVHIIKILAPYKVAPNGNIVSGDTLGKAVLSSLGIVSFMILLFGTIASVMRAKRKARFQVNITDTNPN